MDPLDIAKAFSDLLVSQLKEEELIVICKLNKLANYEGICASVTVCDVWHAMHKAFQQVVGRDYNPLEDDDFLVVNTAWEVAKQNDFLL